MLQLPFVKTPNPNGGLLQRLDEAPVQFTMGLLELPVRNLQRHAFGNPVNVLVVASDRFVAAGADIPQNSVHHRLGVQFGAKDPADRLAHGCGQLDSVRGRALQQHRPRRCSALNYAH